KKELRRLFVSSYQTYRRFYISAGETAAGLSRAYQSYTAAVIRLQSSFFFPNGTFLSPDTTLQQGEEPQKKLPADPEGSFLELLLGQKEDSCQTLLEELYIFYKNNSTVLPNEAKDLYYKLFRCLSHGARQLLLPLPDGGNIVDTLEACFSFEELHQALCQQTAQFFSAAKSLVQESSTIFHIKDYISKNYMNESLSVKDISGHVFLSPSYVCTFFKNETGKTLNQYLTEYRMEKARQLLSDPRYKISEISSRVGYSDGNYFGKSFKKHTGLSPSEYREKNAPGGNAHEKTL
ncbi:MAG: helix-turn-helix transcriptional regulator, partial [Eubacteriales bacterium]|nr:helix-turn-helix transcriptional regulator [Eubacteriales bacterium]